MTPLFVYPTDLLELYQGSRWQSEPTPTPQQQGWWWPPGARRVLLGNSDRISPKLISKFVCRNSRHHRPTFGLVWDKNTAGNFNLEPAESWDESKPINWSRWQYCCCCYLLWGTTWFIGWHLLTWWGFCNRYNSSIFISLFYCFFDLSFRVPLLICTSANVLKVIKKRKMCRDQGSA